MRLDGSLKPGHVWSRLEAGCPDIRAVSGAGLSKWILLQGMSVFVGSLLVFKFRFCDLVALTPSPSFWTSQSETCQTSFSPVCVCSRDPDCLWKAPFSLLFLTVGVIVTWTPEVLTDFKKQTLGCKQGHDSHQMLTSMLQKGCRIDHRLGSCVSMQTP